MMKFRRNELPVPQASDEIPTWDGRIAIVGGCGHVGLPLGMALAEQGFPVDLVDLGAERVNLVNRGLMPFKEDGADELLPRLIQSGRLKAMTDDAVIADAEAVIVTIGTPVGDYGEPDLGGFMRALEKTLSRMRPGQLLALRSTVFPGVTDHLARRMTELGLDDIDLAFCPERIVQEKSLIELALLPQIVGGVTPLAAARAASLFRVLTKKILFVTPIEAELCKLFCNAFRYIQFAIANQFYMMAEQFDANFQRIYDVVREDYPRMKAFARPGFAAGPCLVKDTYQLGAFNHGAFQLGQAALEVNEGLPYMLVQRLARQFDLKNMTVGVLGMAMKANNDDPRDSLSYKLRKVLTLSCHEVLCSDPYVNDSRLVPLDEIINRADLLIVATAHDVYKTCRFRQPVIDISGTIQAGGFEKPINGRKKEVPHVHLENGAHRNGDAHLANGYVKT